LRDRIGVDLSRFCRESFLKKAAMRVAQTASLRLTGRAIELMLCSLSYSLGREEIVHLKPQACVGLGFLFVGDEENSYGKDGKSSGEKGGK
jgi:hypothetical protein